MTEDLLIPLLRAEYELTKLIKDICEDKVDYNADRIYNIESWLRRANHEWDRRALG